MKPIIPFVANIQASEAEDWLLALRTVLPDHTIIPFAELSESQYGLVEVAIVANPDPLELAQLPHLKWVQSLWAGVERLLSDMAEAEFEIVRMTDPQLALSMAEAVLAWTLYLHRDMTRYAEQQQKRLWLQHSLPLASQRRVSLLGLGNLGKKAAHALLSQGFPVSGWSRNPCSMDGIKTFSGPEGLKDILSVTDILVVLLPLTEQTRGLLNAQTLAHLPNDASLINFARGPIVEEAALLDLLDRNHLKHAVLDVFATEPLPTENPLWSHPKITVLPHISAPTNITTASKIAAGNIVKFQKTGQLPETVDRRRGY
jgi:glyoxylate/hydroxypyruvate reductase